MAREYAASHAFEQVFQQKTERWTREEIGYQEDKAQRLLNTKQSKFNGKTLADMIAEQEQKDKTRDQSGEHEGEMDFDDGVRSETLEPGDSFSVASEADTIILDKAK